MQAQTTIEQLEEQQKRIEQALEAMGAGHADYAALKDRVENIAVRLEHVHQTVSAQKSYSSSGETVAFEGIDEQLQVLKDAFNQIEQQIQGE